MKIKTRYFLILMVMLGIVLGSSFASSAASFDDMNASNVFLKQPQGSNTCTLYSAAMMVRRAAMATGNANWSSITADAMFSAAWEDGLGLLYNFTYAGISVGHSTLPGGSGNASMLISLLNNHPEGIVIYDRDVPHAILLTDYTNGTFYCADPGWSPSGRIEVSSASITVNGADDYWYVTAPKVTINTNHLPQGCVDAYEGGAGSFIVRGWAFDRDDPASPVSIHVYLDDERVGILTANILRPDVNSAYPGVGDAHGFNGSFSTSATGSHRITVWAIDIGGDGTTNVKLGSEFVTISPCNHQWDGGSVSKNATCTQAGVMTYTCRSCKATKTEEIPVLKHNYVSRTVAPTRSEKGYTVHECSVCGDSYKDNYTDPITDQAGPVISDIRIYNVTRDGYDVACKVTDESGVRYVAAFSATDEHPWGVYPIMAGSMLINERQMKKNETTGEYTCHIDREIRFASSERDRTEFGIYHTFICAYDNACTVENGMVGNSTSADAPDVMLRETDCVDVEGHKWDNGVVTVIPTDAQNGVKTYTCTACGGTRTEEIAATGQKPAQPGTSVAPQEPKPQKPAVSGINKKKVKVKAIKITGSSTKIAKGKKIALKATISPANASNKAVTWTSSNKRYATVSAKGVVTTKAAGAGKIVKITAKAKDGSGKKAVYTIRIMKGAVSRVMLSGSKTLKANKSMKLKTTVRATSGANKVLAFTSSNKKYATVNAKGVVKALKAGKGKTVTITAKATDGSGKKASIRIKIK